MHNQKRSEYKARFLDPKIRAGLESKALRWNAASRELLVRRGRIAVVPEKASPGGESKEDGIVAASEKKKDGGGNDVDVDLPLALTSKLLTVNPDPSHLWNHRRELLLSQSSSSPDDRSSSPALDLSAVKEELSLTATCLEKNPKAYGAWFHRKWSVRRSLLLLQPTNKDSSSSVETLLRRELDLCGHFLSLDERNFHCWNYRRFVVSALASALCAKKEAGGDGGDATEDAHYERADGSWDFWVGDLASSRRKGRGGPPPHLVSSASPSAASPTMGPQLTTICKSEHDAEEAPPSPPSSLLSDEDRDALLLSEFDFSRTKVESNFSNGSAFHYRSELLPWVLESRWRRRRREEEQDGVGDGDDDEGEMEEERYALQLEMAREELDLIRNATFTEPDDQTSWWYHRFVTSWAAPPPEALEDKRESGESVDALAESYLELLDDEAESLRELIDAEEGRCKWGLLALHMVLTATMGAMTLSSAAEGTTDTALTEAEEEDRRELEEEANECLDKLMELDPDRRARYESMKREVGR